ncbi:hypothetical protein L0F51_11450 [Afifella sp. H1R]|uniref:hypothetical protein n=1 Tax=Afifella sp. H1R TaxID=2908841 RepID=UPI001F4601B5|nr:hypothetical protein [Afifella sp. H1R]MCF1504366.1 hypothetical protein [Afifella sp. H1R]
MKPIKDTKLTDQRDTSSPWDESAIEFISSSHEINAWITSITKTDLIKDTNPFKSSSTLEIYGVLKYTKIVFINIDFQFSGCGIGDFSYFINGGVLSENDDNLMILSISLNQHADFLINNIIKSHKTALDMGKTCSDIRFFKNPGDGEITHAERLNKYTRESRYPITGLVTWDTLESPNLARWARPYVDTAFSMENAPTNPFQQPELTLQEESLVRRR